MNNPFGKLITAMITPFNHANQIDYEEIDRIVNHLIETGSDSIVVCGTTGESATLSHEEEFEIFKYLIKNYKNKIHIIAGTGSNCTRTAVETSKKAVEYGVDGLMLVTPYYNKPSQLGLIQHFTEISKACDVPIMLYNIPGRTAINMELATIKALSSLPNIVAIKEASGDLDQIKAVIEQCPDLLVYSGDDALTTDVIKLGGVGVVSVASHCVGIEIKNLISLMNDGNFTEAERLQASLKPVYDALFITSNPSPVKAALRMMGYHVGKPRLPLVDVTQQEADVIEKALKHISVLN